MQTMLDYVESIVREASQLLIDEVQRPDGPRGEGMKADVDAEIGAFLTERLGRQYPDAGIVCEEGGSKDGKGKQVFYVDPNDGTRDFLLGRRENSISVGLAENGEITLGVVYAPFATELTGPEGMMITWAKGEPIRHNGTTVEPLSSPNDIQDDSVILISTRVQGEKLDANEKLLAPATLKACPSIATRLCLAAVGKVTAAGTAMNPLNPWDFAAAQGILQAAGGDVVGNEGKPIEWSGVALKDKPQTIYFGARSVPFAAEIVKRLTPLLPTQE